MLTKSHFFFIIYNTYSSLQVELLRAQERAAAAGVTLPVPGVGPGRLVTDDVVVTSPPSGNNEYQPSYNQAPMDFSPPALGTEEVVINRD